MELRDVWLQVTGLYKQIKHIVEMQMGPVIPGDPGCD